MSRRGRQIGERSATPAAPWKSEPIGNTPVAFFMGSIAQKTAMRSCASPKESAYHFGAFPPSFLRMRILARPLPKWTAPYHAMSALPPSEDATEESQVKSVTGGISGMKLS